MSSTIDPDALRQWCMIPADRLEDHASAKIRIRILETADAVHRWAAGDMINEVKTNNTAGKPTRWILPCGPTGQYAHFVQAVNTERVSLKNVHVFHMDDFLDWQGRPLPVEHPYSYQGWMTRHFYDPVQRNLAVPVDQRHFPSVFQIDEISSSISHVGGIDTVYGGIGYRGHIAYNEPPRSPWNTITVDQLRESKTRILNLNDDTLVAVSQRTAGGCSHLIPPMAITLGMRDLLGAARIRLMSETGAWKQTVIRVLLFGPTTVEYPVTLVQGHPDAMVVVNRETASHPLSA